MADASAAESIDAFRSDLDGFLASVEQSDPYRVVAELGRSPYEVTQHVECRGAGYIRKFILDDSGAGDVYRALHRGQDGRTRSGYLPYIFDCRPAPSPWSAPDAGDAPWLMVVLEHVEGETLSQAVRRCGPSALLAVDLFPRICDAVTELHRFGANPIIHRDLKPDNIVVSAQRLALIDFGISRIHKQGENRDTRVFGTRAYAPPEQFGYGQTDVRSDVYALGMILYFCLTGREPSAQLQVDSFAGSGVSPAMRDVLVCATAFDPHDRFASAEELKRAFLAAAAGKPLASLPGSQGALRARPHAEEPIRGRRFGGRVWNATVAALWLFMALSAIAMLTDPTSTWAAKPLIVKVLDLGVITFGFVTICAFVSLDRRPLFRYMPWLQRISVPKEAMVLFGSWFVLSLVIKIVERLIGL